MFSLLNVFTFLSHEVLQKVRQILNEYEKKRLDFPFRHNLRPVSILKAHSSEKPREQRIFLLNNLNIVSHEDYQNRDKKCNKRKNSKERFFKI